MADPSKNKRLLVVLSTMALVLGAAGGVLFFVLREEPLAQSPPQSSPLIDLQALDNLDLSTKPLLPDPRTKIVQPAVDKGVAYLLGQIPKIKGWRAGYVGLSGLALLECGVPPDDPAILQLAA